MAAWVKKLRLALNSDPFLAYYFKRAEDEASLEDHYGRKTRPSDEAPFRDRHFGKADGLRRFRSILEEDLATIENEQHKP